MDIIKRPWPNQEQSLFKITKVLSYLMNLGQHKNRLNGAIKLCLTLVALSFIILLFLLNGSFSLVTSMDSNSWSPRFVAFCQTTEQSQFIVTVNYDRENRRGIVYSAPITRPKGGGGELQQEFFCSCCG